MNFFIKCPHFEQCSGCTIKSCDVPPPIFEQASNFLNPLLKTKLTLVQGPAIHWRHRAKLCVRHNEKNPNEPIIGLFEKASHTPLNIPKCQVHHPSINEAVLRLKKFLKQHNTTYYDELTHQGDLRYLQCIVERRTGKLQMTFVLNCNRKEKEKVLFWKKLTTSLYEEEPLFWHSVWLNFQPAKSNVIFGDDWYHVLGNEVLWEKIADLEVPFGPFHFGQANLSLFEKLIHDVKRALHKKCSLVELFAGMGVIGLALSEKCREVTFAEIDTDAFRSFNLAKSLLPQSIQKRLHYKTASFEHCLDLLEGKDVLLVDPPRKGLEKSFLKKALTTKSLQVFVYISCNWDSFERDAKIILEQGWTLKTAKCYLFFPGTNHIETLAIFERNY